MMTSDGAIYLGLILLVLVLLLLVALVRRRNRIRMLQSLLQSFDKPMLLYDCRGKLAYCSPGLVLFGRQNKQALAAPPAKPSQGQAVNGEMVIDFNRYRFIAKLLEYKPGTFGTLVLLEYQGSEIKRKP